jgi:lipopolysaccharide export system permease protein
MNFNSILNRYIIRELIPPFIMNMMFFMFIFLMRQVLEITNMIINYQVGFLNFLLLLAFSMPFFFVYIIPMSVMLAVLLTFLRLSNDNEIVALKAGGVSVYRLAPPVMLFAAVSAVITAVMAIWGLPWGESEYRRIAFDVVRSNFNVGLKERQFNDSFDGVMFFVNEIDLKTRSLKDVFINDNRKEGISSTVIAPRGYLFQGADPYSFILRLYNGMINQVGLDSKSAHTIKYDTYDVQLDLKDAVSGTDTRKKKEYEMSLSELSDQIMGSVKKDKRYYFALMEYHKKFSVPFSCIALALLAIPLGIQTQTARKSAGLGIGLIAFLVYYLLLSIGIFLGKSGAYPPVIGMWMPNVIMGGIGTYLIVQTANDRHVRFFAGLRRLKRLIFQAIGFRIRPYGQDG